MGENTPIERARLVLERMGRVGERVGFGTRHRHAILTVVSLVAVAVVAMAAYSRQGPADPETVRAGIPPLPSIQPFESTDEPASPEVTTAPAALRSKAGEAARFDTVPTTTTAPRQRPTSTAAPEPTTTAEVTSTSEPEEPPPSPAPSSSTSEPEIVPPPTTGTVPPPSIDPEPTRPVETTVVVTQTTRPPVTLPPFLTWLTNPPRTTAQQTPEPEVETTTTPEVTVAP